VRRQLQSTRDFYELILSNWALARAAILTESRLSGLATLLAAVSDGLTMQLCAPEHFDMIAASAR